MACPESSVQEDSLSHALTHVFVHMCVSVCPCLCVCPSSPEQECVDIPAVAVRASPCRPWVCPSDVTCGRVGVCSLWLPLFSTGAVAVMAQCEMGTQVSQAGLTAWALTPPRCRVCWFACAELEGLGGCHPAGCWAWDCCCGAWLTQEDFVEVVIKKSGLSAEGPGRRPR